MESAAPLINRIANSKLVTIKLEDWYPSREFEVIDLKDFLYMELILKEKDFRKAIKEIKWAEYKNNVLLITCSADAIIPTWAYMLISTSAAPFVYTSFVGTKEEYLKLHFINVVNELPFETYKGQNVIIKGCGEKQIPASAFAYLTEKLQPVVNKIMFGEPCSTVPIFKA